MADIKAIRPEAPLVHTSAIKRLVIGLALFALGCLALVTPFIAGKDAALVLGLLLLGSGLLQLWQAFAVPGQRLVNAAFMESGVTVIAGLLLLALPKLALTGLAALLGLSSTAILISLVSYGELIGGVFLAWLKYGQDLIRPDSLLSMFFYLSAKLPLYLKIVSGNSQWTRTDRRKV